MKAFFITIFVVASAVVALIFWSEATSDHERAIVSASQPLDPKAIYTASASVLCSSPFRLKEASSAVIAMDYKWLRTLNCVVADSRLPVTVIERSREWWQVRVRPSRGEGATMYGYRTSFMTGDGRYLDDYGSPFGQPGAALR